MKAILPALAITIFISCIYSCHKDTHTTTQPTTKTKTTDTTIITYPYNDTFTGEYGDYYTFWDGDGVPPFGGCYDSPFVFIVVHINANKIVFLNDTAFPFAYSKIFAKDTFAVDSAGNYLAPIDPSRVDYTMHHELAAYQTIGDNYQYTNGSSLTFQWKYLQQYCANIAVDSCIFTGKKILK